MMNQIASGAESVIYLDKSKNKIIKNRLKKNYRVSELDNSLRTSRTKREAKVLEKLQKIGFNAPKLITVQKDSIEMEYISGDQVKKILEKNSKIAKKIGIMLAKMHDQDIIHGDLTTSNMIFKNDEIFFIDFGLSFFSKRVEDKAVDIHLFKQSLESKHHTIFKKSFKYFLEGYNPSYRDEILKRLSEVEMRGRYKEKT